MTATAELTNEVETAAEMRGQLVAGKRTAYVLAGKATVTIRSTKTGQRFTYRVKKSDGDRPVYFVSLLNGADNTDNYAYVGTIFDNGFRVTRKSRVAPDAPSVVAFAFFSTHMEDARIEVWHEGACGRCGRVLTVPESIESGLGPVCAEKSGAPAATTTYTSAEAMRAAAIIDRAKPAVPFTPAERSALIGAALSHAKADRETPAAPKRWTF
jgi:hypothetical protein